MRKIPEYLKGQILCRSCAAYGECKLEKKGTAIDCRNFWIHRPTSDFIKKDEELKNNI